jgi:AcrR family transcriptional regulator
VRTKSKEAHQEALRSVLEVLSTRGLAGFTIEAVAEHAGVARTTIYRHWTTKEELLGEALASVAAGITVPNTGSARQDLVSFMQRITQATAQSAVAPMAAQLLAEAYANPRLMEVFRRTIVVPRRAQAAEILTAGKRRGEIRDDVDIELVMDAMIGTAHAAALIRPFHEIGDLPERLVDLLWRSIAASGDRMINAS